MPVSETQERIEQTANLLGIEHLLDRYPEELSVGQKTAGRCSSGNHQSSGGPFADEPTGALDSKAATELLRYLAQINQQEKTTILMVTHDPFTASYCNRILFIRDGVFFAEVVKKAGVRNFSKKSSICRQRLEAVRAMLFKIGWRSFCGSFAIIWCILFV